MSLQWGGGGGCSMVVSGCIRTLQWNMLTNVIHWLSVVLTFWLILVAINDTWTQLEPVLQPIFSVLRSSELAEEGYGSQKHIFGCFEFPVCTPLEFPVEILLSWKVKVKLISSTSWSRNKPKTVSPCANSQSCLLDILNVARKARQSKCSACHYFNSSFLRDALHATENKELIAVLDL